MFKRFSGVNYFNILSLVSRASILTAPSASRHSSLKHNAHQRLSTTLPPRHQTRPIALLPSRLR